MTLIPTESSLPKSLVFITNSPEETETAGEKTGSQLPVGSVLALEGPLGAGKTCFVKGIARSLHITEDITSPTYTIVSEYEAFSSTETGEAFSFFHIDAYRLNGEDDFFALGGEEYFDAKCITVVEWPERIAKALPKDTIFVKIAIIEGNRRQISVGAEHEHTRG